MHAAGSGPSATAALARAVEVSAGDPLKQPSPKETGGRGGLDPTRYGDWEKNGRCIDF